MHFILAPDIDLQKRYSNYLNKLAQDICNHLISHYSNCCILFKLLVIISSFCIEDIIFPKVIPVGSDIAGLSCEIISILMVAILSGRVNLTYV